MKSSLGWLASLASGTALWIAAVVVEGYREPWDGEDYMSHWLPSAYVLCAFLGFLFPKRPWRWPLVIMLAQMPVMMLILGGAGPLIGVGLMFLLAYSLPGMVAARLAAGLRRYTDEKLT